MVRTPHFYLLYGMMLMMGVGGLMVTSHAAPVAESMGIDSATRTLALTLAPLANGLGRIGWGWISDLIGREVTMSAVFFLHSVVLSSVLTIGRASPVGFLCCMGLVFFTWGEIYVLIASATADLFGVRNAVSNYGILYGSKGVAAIVAGGVAARMFEKTGAWETAFYGSAALALCSAILAMVCFASSPLPGSPRRLSVPGEGQPELPGAVELR